MSAAILLQDLIFSWNASSPPLLHIPQWQVNKGEHVFLHGPSGSGKSTLLNLLSGVLSPDSGQLTLLERDITGLSSRKRDQFRSQHIGLIFQQFNLIPYLSVWDNIKLVQYFSTEKGKTGSIEDLLERLELQSVRNQLADQLSIGQQQRVAIARALINQPQIIIADEPTSALDSNIRDNFIHLLLDVAADSTVIFVSHDQALATHFSGHQALNDLNIIKGNI